MFRLHDITRRWVCRGAFLAAAVVPTLGVLGWAAVEHRPGRVAAYERLLRQHLRLAVSLDDVAHPRPGRTLLSGVKISDPQSGDALLTCPRIEATRRAGRLVIVTSPIEVNLPRLNLLADMIRGRMRDAADGGEPDVRWVAQGLTFIGGDLRQTFTDIVGDVRRGPEDVRTSLRFRLVGEPKAELGQLQIVLARAAVSAPRVAVELHTGGSAIPLAPLVALWPALAHSGDNAQFRGALWANDEASGWHGEISGHLSDVDLTRLVTEQFPHKVSGLARVTLDKAKFHGSRLVQATVRLESDGGQIEDSLVAAAEKHLGLTRRKSPGSSERYHTYTKIRLWAELGDGQLTLRAGDGGDGRGAIVSDAHGGLLYESTPNPQPIVNLVRALVPQRETLVPASAETETLLRRLPLSVTRPANRDETAPPRSSIRVEPAVPAGTR